MSKAVPMTKAAFVAAFGGVYEHSPWVAERAFGRGVTGLDARALHGLMKEIVDEATPEEKLALLRAHPELGANRPLTAYSHAEQMGAGLTRAPECDEDELATLNAAYRDKFGFPFIVAVAGLQRADILDRLRARLKSAPEDEFAQALSEVHKIALNRLLAGS